jgi:hypothetical protein
MNVGHLVTVPPRWAGAAMFPGEPAPSTHTCTACRTAFLVSSGVDSPSRAGWVLQVLPCPVEVVLGLLRPTEPLQPRREEGEVSTGGAGRPRTTAHSIPTLAAIPAATSRPRPESSGP